MRSSVLVRLLGPIAPAIARQLARPRGWFGRTFMTRVLNRGNRELIEATLDGLPLSAGSRLLDVGFGGGLLLELAYARGARTLAGVDPSDVAVARLRGTRRFEGAELQLDLGVVESLPLADASCDVVASTNTVYFWPDLDRAFAELHRVLRPGGVISIGFSGAEKMRGFSTITQHGFRLHENEALLEAARRAGFTDVRVATLHGRRTTGDHVLRAAR